MTVNTSTSFFQSAGDGVTTSFGFPAPVQTPADLTVELVDVATGAVTTQVLDTDYAVAIAPDGLTATVNVVTPVPVGKNINRRRNADYKQPISLPANGPLPNEAIEEAVDRLVMQLQALRDSVARTVKVSDAEPALSQLPNAQTRASSYFGFGPGGEVALFSAAPTAKPQLAADLVINVPADYPTLQAAISGAFKYDINGFTIKCKLADGTYQGAIIDGPMVGAQQAAPGATPGFIIEGNLANPGNVVIASSTWHALQLKNRACAFLRGVRLQTTGFGGNGWDVSTGALLYYTQLDFGACRSAHMNTQFGGMDVLVSPYTLTTSGNPVTDHKHTADLAMSVWDNAAYTNAGMTSCAAWLGAALSSVQAHNHSYSGYSGLAGSAFLIHDHGKLDTGLGGVPNFPGNLPGTCTMYGIIDSCVGVGGFNVLGSTLLNGNITAFGRLMQVVATAPGDAVNIAGTNSGTTAGTNAAMILTTNTGDNVHQATFTLTEDGSNNGNALIGSPGNLDLHANKAGASMNFFPNNAWTVQLTGAALLPIVAFDLGSSGSPMQRVFAQNFLANPYTVATMPAVGAGAIGYASDGRKNGEGAGAGTGVLAFKDGSAWRACDTGATLVA